VITKRSELEDLGIQERRNEAISQAKIRRQPRRQRIFTPST
jgi:hypothetical protein